MKMMCQILIRYLSLIILFLMPAMAQANVIASDIRAQLSAAERIGQVQVRFVGLRLYSAALFTEEGAPFNWSRPFALELKYARRFSRERLVSASMSELERMEGRRTDHSAIASKLKACFRTVKASDRFVAIPDGKNSVRFYHNGRQTCRLSHANIRSRLLGIWLSDRARNLHLSRNLRGLD